MMNKRGIFITATDTGVGKTWLACRLIPLLQAHLLPLKVRKPVESGCHDQNGHLFAEDAQMLLAAAGYIETLEQVCRYRLQAAASPARAAELANIPLRIADLVAACATDTTAFSLIEGAGGFYSPIAQDGLNADLAQQLQLPLLLVCPNRLGCLSSTLLTLEAAQRRRIKVLAVAINRLSASPDFKADRCDWNNPKELASLTDVPIFDIQYAQDRQQQLSELASHIIACQ